MAKRINLFLCCFTVLVLHLVGTFPAMAQDLDPPPKDLQVDASLYIWLPSVDGISTLGGVSTKVDVSAGEVIEASDSVFGWDFRAEAWYQNRFGFAIETLGTLSELKETTKTTPAIDIKVRTELAFIDFEGGYRLLDAPIGAGDMRLVVDVLAGARYIHYESTSDATSLGPLGIISNLGGTAEWIEPIVGGRIQFFFSRQVSASVRGNAGGFGAGDSELTWRLVGLLNYQINDHFRVSAGYQIFGIDMEEGSGRGAVGFDGELYGPVIGATLSF